MKFKFLNKELDQLVGKFLEGGEMTPPEQEPASAPELSGSPEEQIIAACQQALETLDCNLAMQVLLAIMLMMGGSVPEGPQAPEGSSPVYKRGGKFSKWVKK